MKSSITDRQMFFVLFLILTTYTTISIPKVIAQTSGQGGWIALMIAALFFAVFAAVLVRLNSAFPGMMLYDYSRRIAGKVVAFALGVYFVLYFLLVLTYLNIQLTGVLQAEFYPKTPKWAMLAASIIVVGSVAHRGVNGVARFFELIGSVFVVTSLVTHLIMFQQGDPREILPIFRASQMQEYLMGAKDVVIAFLGVEVLTVFPLGGKKVRRSMATALFTVLFVGVFYVLVVETCIMILGMQSAQNYNFALIEAIKQIDNPILERFDILYLTVGFSGLVTGICGVYLAVVEYAVRLLGKVKRVYIVTGVGVVAIALGAVAQSVKSAADAMEVALEISGLVSAVLIPTILLLTAKVRRLVEKPQ